MLRISAMNPISGGFSAFDELVKSQIFDNLLKFIDFCAFSA